MVIQKANPGLPARRACASPASPAPQAAAGDKVDIKFEGSRPAHRVVKKLARTGACLVGAAGAAKVAFDLLSAPTLAAGLPKALLSLGLTSGAVVGMDLASGLWHHHGDNYGSKAQSLNHVKWHTDTEASDYCLVGLSNQALDKIGFWPKWEKLIYQTTGQQPVSWQVAPYKSYCLGEIDEATLRSRQAQMGMPT